MKITRAEADLIERVRENGAEPALVSANLQALARGFVDIKQYLCPHCIQVTEKVLLFRAILK